MLLRLAISLASLVTLALTAQPPPTKRGLGDKALLPRADALKVLAVGHRELFADYYFIQMLQQVTTARTPEEHREISDYAKLSTALDPKFRSAYLTGALMTPYNHGNDRWVNTIESTELVRAAVAEFPEDDGLAALLGFNLTFYLRQYAEAAAVYARLADRPNAAPYYRALSIRLLSQGGQLEKALALSQTLAEGAEDEEAKALYSRRVKELQLEQVLQQVERTAIAFTKERGRAPGGVIELVQTGYLDTFPSDPLGGRIYLDPTGKARSTSRWYRFQLYETKRKLQNQAAIGPEAEFVPETND